MGCRGFSGSRIRYSCREPGFSSCQPFQEPHKHVSMACLPLLAATLMCTHRQKGTHMKKQHETLFKNSSIYVYVCMYSHVYMFPWLPEEGTGPLEAGAEGCGEPPDMGARN